MDDWPDGLSTGCFYQQSILTCLETIKDHGFDSIEVCSLPNRFYSFRPRTEFHGTGYWSHGRHRRHWIAGGQDSLLALGTLSSSPLGNSENGLGVCRLPVCGWQLALGGL